MSVVAHTLVFWFFVLTYFVASLYAVSATHAFFATIYLYILLYLGRKYSGNGTWAGVLDWIKNNSTECVKIVLAALTVCAMTVVLQGNRNYLEVALFFIHASVFFWAVMVVGSKLRLKWKQRRRDNG